MQHCLFCSTPITVVEWRLKGGMLPCCGECQIKRGKYIVPAKSYTTEVSVLTALRNKTTAGGGQ